MNNSNNWIEWNWTPEKPYPEPLETEVFVEYADGTGKDWACLNVGFWYADEGSANNWHPSNGDASIVAYRLA